MNFSHRPRLLIAALFAFAAVAAGILAADASVTPTNQQSQRLISLSPTNLRLPTSATECVNHVYLHGQGYYEHAAYGCSHPTANYIILIWDYAGRADAFHIYRTDVGRMDYGIHREGTMAEIYYPGGRVCYVVTAVQGSTESSDSNQFCMIPPPIKLRTIPH